MLYIIGLGLNEKGISAEGLEIVSTCKKIFLEKYTVDFPYTEKQLEEVLKKKFVGVDREFVESLRIVDMAQKQDVALLVYGSPLMATTHIAIVKECKESGVKCKVIHAASVFDAVAETGLQLYKFGKIVSLPEFEADSFMEVVKENLETNAHSLILIDIGLEFQEALKKLEDASKKYDIKLDKIILCQALGTKRHKIFYDKIGRLKNLEEVAKPFCIIIPGKLHFLEEEFLNGLRKV